MHAHTSSSVTCTLSADDIKSLIEDGEITSGNVTISTPEPERERFKRLQSE